jgi:non-ribosomal peptide synthetase component E (peptide arylation enzyme)
MAIDLPLTSPEEAARYRMLGLWRDVTLTECFQRAASRYPDKTAIIEKTRRLTYSQLRTMVDDLAGNLLDLGLSPGEVVAVQSKNAAEQPLVHLACNRVGLLYMPVHDSWRDIELKHLLKLAKAQVLVIPGEYRGFDHAAMIADIRPDLPNLKHVFTLDGATRGFRDFAELLQPTARTDADLASHRPDPDLPGHVMLSGGTTALSKISRFSSNDLLTLLKPAAEGSDFSERDVVGALAPAGTGATGYIYGILMPLLHGATSVILERWGDPAEAVDLLVDNKCTYAVGIPTQLTRLIPVIEQRGPQAFTAFRCFLNAGAPLTYETGLRIERLMGCAVQTSYGSTDGGVPTMTTIHDPQEKRLRTVGKVVQGCECEIRDPEGERLPLGESGEVVWRGADKSWGYLGDDAQTALTFTADRFYKSGDVGRFDEDGYLQIVGRIKDMILRGGRNVSPVLIEDLLSKHPSVLEVAVAAMPDPELGERACAFVVLRDGATLDFDGMIAFMKAQKVAVWQLPERLEIVADLPRGVGGKITKKDLTAMITAKLEAERLAGA